MNISKKKGFWPALALFFLAPAIGELLSGSAPPVEFFNPVGMLILAALYGSGAILIRELRVRWDKGWPTVFVLGAAYGILEEGLMVKSFFDPNWIDLGILGVYGRWAGVNWVWSLNLTIYHAVFSIAIPILLVEMIFPEQRQERWIGRRGMVGFSLLLVTAVVLGALALTPYRPPVIPYLLALLATVGLFMIARRLPARWSWEYETRAGKVPRPWRFTALGFAATVVFFGAHWLLPEWGAPAAVAMLVSGALVLWTPLVVRRMSRYGAWDDRRRLALASGALSFFILLVPLQQLDPERMDNTAGMALVGLAALLMLVWLWRRVSRITEAGTLQTAPH